MMTKLTKDILLKKGIPKSSHLKNVKTLNLSNMQLETKDIDSQLFSQMLNLEELDISKNNLSELPGKLSLPKLKVLNFSDNQIEDVTPVQQFPSLEEVLYEENLYLTVSDNYKVFCLLPKLQRLNNKYITSLANHIRFVNHRELSSRVESYWEKNYKDKLPDEPTPAIIKSVSKEFLKSVGNRVKYGPNSIKDFTKWKVQVIADNLISSFLAEKKRSSVPQSEQASSGSDAAEVLQTQNVETDCEVRSPSRRHRLNVETDPEVKSPSKRLRSSVETNSEQVSPTKRLRSNDVLAIVLSPKRSSKLQESPLKRTPVKGQPDSTPVKEEAPHILLTPTKVSLRSTPSKQTVDKTVTSGKEKKDPRKKKQFNLEPLHFIQCHSKNNDSDDFCTQLWSCAFEPSLDSSNNLSKVIATCGGGSVCVTDCETGKVLKKYKVPGEEFFTLAWTTLTMICKEGQKRKINVLAAGGRFGIVKLMYPKVGLCYGEIKAHKKAISIMCFSPTQETFLFSKYKKQKPCMKFQLRENHSATALLVQPACYFIYFVVAAFKACFLLPVQPSSCAQQYCPANSLHICWVAAGSPPDPGWHSDSVRLVGTACRIHERSCETSLR